MTPRAPLLSASDAKDLYAIMDGEFGGHDHHGPQLDALQALATGRTYVGHVMTEDECRAQFEKWQRETCCMPDWWLVRSGDEYVESDAMHEWECWLACARAMGAVR